MPKIVIAFLLGLFGFFVMMFVGETAGLASISTRNSSVIFRT